MPARSHPPWHLDRQRDIAATGAVPRLPVLKRLLFVASMALAALSGSSTSAQVADCRLALVLALDASSSVDLHEYRLQREGLARALTDPQVERLFFADLPIALCIFEWASPEMQEPLFPDWVLVEQKGALAQLAQILMTHPRTGDWDPHKSTGIGAALVHASAAFDAAPPGCGKRTIDVSGDGENNDGPEPRFVYDHYPLADVVVNALVIGGDAATEDDISLSSWFAAHVLHGEGAFWLKADSYEDFERAMKIKLIRELEVPHVCGLKESSHAG